MTKEKKFLLNGDVQDFIDWLASACRTLAIKLDIPSSSKAPGGVKVTVNGIQSVTQYYKWKTTWHDPSQPHPVSVTWSQTRDSLAHISKRLCGAIISRNDHAAKSICSEILQFGGDRNSTVGTMPFLNALSSVTTYLEQAQKALSLRHADLNKLQDILKMNSMLTKIHALAANDGLPIYDSRVALAMAALVEMYRRQTSMSSISPHLRFPAVLSVRTVGRYFPGSISPGSVAARGEEETGHWAQAKIRLGWIMNAVLDRNPKLFSDTQIIGEAKGMLLRIGQMHAFEAALFMIGADPKCLVGMPPLPVPKTSSVSSSIGRRGKSPVTSKKPLPRRGRKKVVPAPTRPGHITLDFGGAFPLSTLYKHVKKQPGRCIVIGAQKATRRQHTKVDSLDYWLRHYATQPTQMQATKNVVGRIVASGKFRLILTKCPTSGRPVKALKCG